MFMVSDDELQQELQKFADGEKIDLDLVKHFYNQNDGYLVINQDEESATGFIPKTGSLLIDIIDIDEDQKAKINEAKSLKVPVSTPTAQKLINEIRVGTKSKFGVAISKESISTEESGGKSELHDHDDMYA